MSCFIVFIFVVLYNILIDFVLLSFFIVVIFSIRNLGFFLFEFNFVGLILVILFVLRIFIVKLDLVSWYLYYILFYVINVVYDCDCNIWKRIDGGWFKEFIF